MNATDLIDLGNRFQLRKSFVFNEELDHSRAHAGSSNDRDSNHLQALPLKEWNWNLINPRYAYSIKRALFITVTGIGAVATPWKLARVWGATVLVAVGYGIINDLFACRVCPEYFTANHIYDGEEIYNRLVKTLDPNVNALAWGVVATSTLAALGGAIISTGAVLSGADEKTVIISMVCYSALTLLVADLISRFEKNRIERTPSRIYSDIPDQFQSRWWANDTRNTIGYLMLLIGGMALCIIMGKMK